MFLLDLLLNIKLAALFLFVLRVQCLKHIFFLLQRGFWIQFGLFFHWITLLLWK